MKPSEEIDRFKFSIAAITALVTFSYISYNFIQNNAINSNLYSLVIVIISSTIIIIMMLIFPIFLKALSREIKNNQKKEKIETLASEVYQYSYISLIIIFIFSCFFYYILDCIFNNYEVYDNVGFILSVVLIVFTTLFFHLICVAETDSLSILMYKRNLKKNLEENESKKNKFNVFLNAIIKGYNKIKIKIYSLNQTHPKIFNFLLRLCNSKLSSFLFFRTFYLVNLYGLKLFKTLCIWMVCLLLIYIFIVFLFLGFMSGDVQIDISNIHYKNDTQIPVLIQVTGPNTGLSIELFKEYSNNLSRIAYIDYLEPQHTLNTSSNNSLVGNSLDIGKYSVFINTTNLTTGYYELKCVRPKFGGTHESFYLLESN